MKTVGKKRLGFTIVELLIVIVVIAILAAITIVAYNGIQDRANAASLDAQANQMGKKVMLYHAENGSYPVSLADAGVTSEAGFTYSYMTVSSYFCAAIQKTGTTYASGSGSTGKCGGLNAKYYNNAYFTDPVVLERFDKDLYNYWGTGSPGPGVNSDNFSVRWEGYLTAPVTDTYTFTLISDDHSKLFFDGSVVYDETSCCTTRTFTYNLTAGQRIPVRWDMQEYGGGAYARLQWSYTGQATTPIPPSAFSV